MFGDLGQLGQLVQNLVEPVLDPVLDPVPRLSLKNLVELVQDPEVTANLATHNLVQVITLNYLINEQNGISEQGGIFLHYEKQIW